MKTLSELKRTVKIGTKIKMIFSRFPNKYLDKARYVVKINSVGIELNENPEAKTGSFLPWPKSSLLEYNDNKFIICEEGERKLTEAEKQCLINQPKDDEQDKIDLMTDGSTMYFRRKRYFAEKKMDYLFISTATKKLRRGTKDTAIDGSFSDWSIEDSNCKGEPSLGYEIIE